MRERDIEMKMKELPEDLKKEVLDYIEFLLKKYKSKERIKGFKFDWEGRLSELREEFTSDESQYKEPTRFINRG